VKYLLALVLLLAACGGATSGVPAATLPPEARNAPDRVAAEGHTYILRSDLYSDLMPGPRTDAAAGRRWDDLPPRGRRKRRAAGAAR